ncbi:MAG: DUF3891 family protein [Verrucomicrobia bacterium]|jgi:hypothetical protein|nr:DUF3891 family protein [Verrucomicrobiota bacterium]
MIRIETDNAWLLLEHAEHAALAGEFARHWKNEHFAPPEPFSHILDACARHDDSWRVRDAVPVLTAEGNPSAFSSELVGTYDAFEEIDMEDYLSVRGQATEAAASRDPYAAVLISMHTVDLLTEQANLTTLNEAERQLHADFIEGQRRRQAELKATLRDQPDIADLADDLHFQRGFEFLQACDSFSLYVGVDFPDVGTLRHRQPTRQGDLTEIKIHPLGDNRYRLAPYPLDEPEVTFHVPYRRIPKSETVSLARFQAAYATASIEIVCVTVIQ